jgi:peptide/nickel transport system permease protein
MGAFIARRLFHTLFVLLGVTLLIFVLTRLSGDPTALYLGDDATEAEIEAFRERMGWNRPILVQYAAFLWHVTQGDFGTSLRHREPALQLVLERMPATLELTVVSLAFSLALAVPVGVFSAVWRNSIFDSVARSLALCGLCIPNFWFGIVLIIVFAVELGVLPAFGRESAANLILPGITLGFSSAATTMRLLRSNVLEVLGLDYVRTARAKGLGEWVVLTRHVLKNAAIPTVTVMALQLGHLLSGAVITETVFAWPGMGRLAVQAIANRDFTVVQAFVGVSAIMFTLANLAADLTYTLLDPRIRH